MLISAAVFNCDFSHPKAFFEAELASKESRFSFFQTSSLQEFLDWFRSQSLSDFGSDATYLHLNVRQHCYFRLKITQDNDHEQIKLYVIIANKSLEHVELFYLFRNLGHLHRARLSHHLNGSIDDMIMNPLGYTNRDMQTNTIQSEVEGLRSYMANELIPTLIERGDRISQLEDKTIKLDVESFAFRQEAKKMNRCCKWW